MAVSVFEDEGSKLMINISIPFACLYLVVISALLFILHAKMNWRPVQYSKYAIADAFKANLNSVLIKTLTFLWWMFFLCPIIIPVIWGIIVAAVIKPYIIGIIIMFVPSYVSILVYIYFNYRARGYPSEHSYLYFLIALFSISIILPFWCILCQPKYHWESPSYFLPQLPLFFFVVILALRRKRIYKIRNVENESIEDENWFFLINSINDVEGGIEIYLVFSFVIISVFFNSLYMGAFQYYYDATIGTGCMSLVIDICLVLKYLFVSYKHGFIKFVLLASLIKIFMVSFTKNYWLVGHGILYNIFAFYNIERSIHFIVKMCSDEKNQGKNIIYNFIIFILVTTSISIEVGVMQKREMKIFMRKIRQQDLVVFQIISGIFWGLSFGFARMITKSVSTGLVFPLIILLFHFFLSFGFQPTSKIPTLSCGPPLTMYYLSSLYSLALVLLKEKKKIYPIISFSVASIALVAVTFAVKGCTTVFLGINLLITALILYLYGAYKIYKDGFSITTSIVIGISYIILILGFDSINPILSTGIDSMLIFGIGTLSFIGLGILNLWKKHGKMWLDDILMILVPSLVMLIISMSLVFSKNFMTLSTVYGIISSMIFFAGLFYYIGFNDILHKPPTQQKIGFWGFFASMAIIVIVFSIPHMSFFISMAILQFTIELCSVAIFLFFEFQNRNKNFIVFAETIFPIMEYTPKGLKVSNLLDTSIILGFISPWIWGAFATVFYEQAQYAGLAFTVSHVLFTLLIVFCLVKDDDMIATRVYKWDSVVFRKIVNYAIGKLEGFSGNLKEDFSLKGIESASEASDILKAECNFNKYGVEYNALIKALYIYKP